MTAPQTCDSLLHNSTSHDTTDIDKKSSSQALASRPKPQIMRKFGFHDSNILLLKGLHLRRISKLDIDSIRTRRVSLQVNHFLQNAKVLSTMRLNLMLTNNLYLKYFRLHNLACLSTAHIVFDTEREIANKNFRAFPHDLKNLARLSELTLEFNYCKGITDRSINSLSAAIKHLCSLKTLNLRISRCYNISDEGIHQIFRALKHLPSLAALKLDFERSENITDKFINSLSISLRPLAYLFSLDLDFSHCKQISDSGIKSLSLDLPQISYSPKKTYIKV